MALLWFDGFESYGDTLSDLANAYRNSPVFADVYVSPGDTAIDATGGRRSSRGLRINKSDSNINLELASSYTSMVIGYSLYQQQNQTVAYFATEPFLKILDGTTIHLRFHLLDGEILVYNGAGTLLGTSVGFGMVYDVSRYFEVKFTIDNSAGSVVIRSNEVEILSLSSVDTQNSANANFNHIFIGGLYNDVDVIYDDFYICDLTGGAPCNDFLGDVRVDVLRPNGAGTYTDFAPSAGSNYQNVDEDYSDDDSTYNDGASVADQDSYALGDLPAPSGTTIYGVKSQITVRKTDAGAMEAKLLTRVGTTDDLGDAITLGDTFSTHPKIFVENPDDSAAWEDADVNGMEVGVEITA